MAASSKPLGMVVATDHARLDNANAAIGADIYSGDALATDVGGSLRMKVGPSQVYLLSASSATLVPQENRVQAKVEHGTVGFSTASPEQLEIGTPLGVIRGANSQRVFGQVAVLSATKMQISAYEGTLLVVAANGEQKTIQQGQTYEATLAADPEPGGGQNRAWRWRNRNQLEARCLRGDRCRGYRRHCSRTLARAVGELLQSALP